MRLLASNAYVDFYFHDDGCRTLEAVWSNYANTDYSRMAVLLGLSLVRQHQIDSWVADDRKLGPLSEEDLNWLAAEILPALAASGLRRLAVVESESRQNRELLEEAYSAPFHVLGIEVRHFSDVLSARAWACTATAGQ